MGLVVIKWFLWEHAACEPPASLSLSLISFVDLEKTITAGVTVKVRALLPFPHLNSVWKELNITDPFRQQVGRTERLLDLATGIATAWLDDDAGLEVKAVNESHHPQRTQQYVVAGCGLLVSSSTATAQIASKRTPVRRSEATTSSLPSVTRLTIRTTFRDALTSARIFSGIP
ncbi:hypothetical protein Pelo_19083 [Pelomyxa schiedti]|nr:hypothetical protein Pelo_19083 [Pelomyxa schiedti]